MCKENLNCLLTERCTNEATIRADERAKTIEEVVRFISTHVYGWQDLRNFLEQMKGDKV